MLISERIKKIIEDFETFNISSYEVSKETTITQQGIDNIIKGKTEKPRKETLIEIENYINSQYDNTPPLQKLEKQCIDQWEELKKRPLFAKHLEVEVLSAINRSLEDKLNERDNDDEE